MNACVSVFRHHRHHIQRFALAAYPKSVQSDETIHRMQVLEVAQQVAKELRALQDEYILTHFKDGCV